MERETEAHDINGGEHAANDRPAIDWKAYHANTLPLTLRKKHEALKNQKKTAHR